MFKKTLNFSALKSDPSILSEMKDGDVFQIVHRGSEIKVVMTQEYFFRLMEKVEKAEGVEKVTPYNANKLMKEFESKMTRINDILNKEEKKS
jgi:hypothetical protein